MKNEKYKLAPIEETNTSYGLNKLEHFTALAMQGILSNDSTDIEQDREWLVKNSLDIAHKTLDALAEEEIGL